MNSCDCSVQCSNAFNATQILLAPRRTSQPSSDVRIYWSDNDDDNDDGNDDDDADDDDDDDDDGR